MTELKTLKDITKIVEIKLPYIEAIIDSIHGKGVFTGTGKDKQNFVLLKLKDSQLIEVKELKEEAVKWVKHYNSDVVREAFKIFFNITEEDLK